MKLSIPTHPDPIARIAVVALLALLVVLPFLPTVAAGQAIQPDPIFIYPNANASTTLLAPRLGDDNVASPTALPTATAETLTLAAPPTAEMPTAGATEIPTDEPPPPAVEQPAYQEPVVVYQQPAYQEPAYQEPPPPEPTAAPEPTRARPNMIPPPEPTAAPLIIIISDQPTPDDTVVFATPAPGDPGFADSFEQPTDRCSNPMVGALGC